MMELAGERVLLRIYLRSADRPPLAPTHERLIKAARAGGLSGATVMRGIIGFGSSGELPRRAWSLVEVMPVILEIVDDSQRIVAFIDGPMSELMAGGTATIERAHVMMYRHRQAGEARHLQLAGAIAPLSTLPKIELRGPMQTKENGVLLRIFIGSDDRAGGRPLYEAILRQARQLGLAGATVLRGTEGFGAHSVVHKAALLEMSTDLPIVIEIADSEDKINLLLPWLQETVKEGMITMEHVVILLYRQGEPQRSMS